MLNTSNRAPGLGLVAASMHAWLGHVPYWPCTVAGKGSICCSIGATIDCYNAAGQACCMQTCGCHGN